MVTLSLQIKKLISVELLLILCALILVGCKLTPLKVDPCFTMPDSPGRCYAIPINQKSKPAYERALNLGDVCVTMDEYATMQKSYRELMRKCGDRCQ